MKRGGGSSQEFTKPTTQRHKNTNLGPKLVEICVFVSFCFVFLCARTNLGMLHYYFLCCVCLLCVRSGVWGQFCAYGRVVFSSLLYAQVL